MLRRWVPAHFGAVRRHIGRSATTTTTTSTSSAALYALWEKGLQQRAAGDLNGCAASFKECLARCSNNYKNTATTATSSDKARAAADMRTVAKELGLVMLALEQPIADAVTYFRMAVGEDDEADATAREEEAKEVLIKVSKGLLAKKKGREKDALTCVKALIRLYETEEKKEKKDQSSSSTFSSSSSSTQKEKEEEKELQLQMDLASSLTFAGTIYYSMGSWSDAVSMFEKASGIYNGLVKAKLKKKMEAGAQEETKEQEKERATVTKLLATVYNNLGVSYHRLKDREGALGMFKACLQAYGQLPDDTEDMEDVAASLANMGMVHAEQGSLPFALDCYRRCAEQLEKLPQCQNSLALAEAYNAMGHIYFRMKDFEKAVDFATKFKDMAEARRAAGVGGGGEEVDALAAAWASLGLIREQHQMLDVALEAYKTCFALQQQRMNAVNEEITSADPAEEEEEGASEQRQKKRRQIGLAMSSTQLKIGGVYRRLALGREGQQGSNLSGAIAALRLSADLRDEHTATVGQDGSISNNEGGGGGGGEGQQVASSSSPQELIEAARCHNYLGMCLLQTNETVTARGHFLRCLQIMSSGEKDSNKNASALSSLPSALNRRQLWHGRDIATVHMNIGETLKREGDSGSAVQQYLDAVKLLEKGAGPNSIELITAYGALVALYEQQRVLHKAAFYKKQLAALQNQRLAGKGQMHRGPKGLPQQLEQQRGGL